MKKIKTSMSLDGDRLDRLKRLAERERRSVSQLVDLAVEQLLPVLAEEALDVDEICPVQAKPALREATV